jgi:pseudaminic acid synthase
MLLPINIGNFSIDINSRAFIIAELSCNHRQNIDIARRSILGAKRAGANAVKVQTFTPDTMTLNCTSPQFIISGGTPWDGRTFYDLYHEAFLPWEWHEELQALAIDEGLVFFSSPFDRSAVDFLETLNVPAYKIASFEMIDPCLVEYIASKGKPVLMSTGIATLDDIDAAMKICRDANNDQVILLKCTSSYPAPLTDTNIRNLQTLRDRYNVNVGVSDHSEGMIVPVTAVTLGARVIEKHFILDRALGGPDALFSLTENEFQQMTLAVRNAESALGETEYVLTDPAKAAKQFGRSLYASRRIDKGERLTEKNIRSIRPGFGLPPREFKSILGKRALVDIPFGTPLSWSLIGD